MMWRKATSFIFGAGVAIEDAPRRGESAIIALHISREAPAGVMRRFRRKRIGADFNPPRWLTPDQLEREFFATLPDLVTGDIEPAEVAELKRIFGKDGELPAVKL